MVDKLPNAKHEDIYCTIQQLVKRRDLLVKNNVMNKNTLHNQLMYSYPSYRKFFSEIDGKSALHFWENYPSPMHIKNTTPEKVYEALKAINQSLKMERILQIHALIEADGDTKKDGLIHPRFLVNPSLAGIFICGKMGLR